MGDFQTNRSWKSWLRQIRRLPSNFVAKVSNSPKHRKKTTSEFYIGYCDEPDGVDSDCDINESSNFSYATNDSSFDMSGDECNSSLQQDANSIPKTIKTCVNESFYEKRTSSYIDLLRISALKSINKQNNVCKSAECLLNDYGDTQLLHQRKKQRSCELLDAKFEKFEPIDATGQTKKGHSRSKSAYAIKDVALKGSKSPNKKDMSKLGKTKTEADLIPRIAITQYSTENPASKSRTLPRTLDVSTLEQGFDIFADQHLSHLQPKSSKRSRKRDKISNIFSSVAGEKRGVMRYD